MAIRSQNFPRLFSHSKNGKHTRSSFKRDNQDLPPLYGLQFHPEVTHSEDGRKIIENFIFDIAELKEDWSPAQFVENTVSRLKEELGDESVVLGLSGGVDSSVAALLFASCDRRSSALHLCKQWLTSQK